MYSAIRYGGFSLNQRYNSAEEIAAADDLELLDVKGLGERSLYELNEAIGRK